MSKKKKIKWVIYTLIVIAAAALLEVCAFNFKPIAVSLGWRADETRAYTLADIPADGLINCVMDENGLKVTAEGASFTLTGLGYELNTVRIVYEADGIAGVNAFCDSNKEDKTVSLENGAGNTVIDATILSVRFDLDAQAGATVRSFTVIINDYRFDFSWARFVAMIAVAVITRALFGLQRPIDYGIDTSANLQKQEKEDTPQGESR